MKPIGSILRGRRVLVADDEMFGQSIVKRMVYAMGAAEVLTAQDGDEALRHLSPAGCNLTLAILDFNMPGANGLQILKHIRMRKVGAQHDIHVVMLTGMADRSLIGAALALDVDAFVVKPVSQAAFAAKVDAILAEYRDIRAAHDYDKVDIDAVAQGLITYRPAPTAPPKPASHDPTVLHVPLDQVTAGAVLAVDIFSPAGELLLAKGSTLTERFLRRLKELQGLIGLETLAIYTP